MAEHSAGEKEVAPTSVRAASLLAWSGGVILLVFGCVFSFAAVSIPSPHPPGTYPVLGGILFIALGGAGCLAGYYLRQRRKIGRVLAIAFAVFCFLFFKALGITLSLVIMPISFALGVFVLVSWKKYHQSRSSKPNSGMQPTGQEQPAADAER